MDMKTRKLGNLEVSEIGVGCMGFSHGYGQIPEEKYSIEAIREAFEKGGCTHFDTAEVYGPHLAEPGHNELLVGKALKPIRRNVTIATKLHLHPDEVQGSNVYDEVKRHIVGSMKRLGTDFIDLYYLHRINEEVSFEEVAAAMGRLIQEGLIGGWGLSAVDTDIISKAHAITLVSAVQNIYSMVERGSEKKVIPFCMEHNIGFVPFSPIASGLLSGKISSVAQFEKNDDVRNIVPQLSQDNLAGNQPIVDLVRKYAEIKEATPAQISLAWMLHKWPNVVPIPGSKNKARILENLGAADVELTSDEFADIETALSKCKIHGSRGFVETEQHNAFRSKIK